MKRMTQATKGPSRPKIKQEGKVAAHRNGNEDQVSCAPAPEPSEREPAPVGRVGRQQCAAGGAAGCTAAPLDRAHQRAITTR